MTAYYLSGPMRNKPNYNHAEFAAVERDLDNYLVSFGDDKNTVINPAKNFDGVTDLPTTTYMSLDLQQVLESDIVVLIHGWETSEGANREANVAVWSGKRFMSARQHPTTGTYVFTAIDAPDFNGPSPRASALNEARDLITGDRNNTYGSPTQDFERSANALNAYGYRGPDGRTLLPHDIAIMIMAVKISRLMWTPKKRDSWVDVAGYAGCGYECAMEEL